ncbi:phosphoribosylglycinamide formyltransferase [Tritrichomonas foetus]|uniref:phosphoribosylglycinamide formyltransferase 1 n=1 Tax=Tritrichomonas foetus TaxID=1144522 RepID=A0A1J4JAZ8_9EUKA|nr:phosphoribosylglycinamide formyltransferase [Tritrichomonas foetus]|eukprot:OHS95407.1 phosphoribosylglycinamide formyltransferase [Tritrichomonas foetus]
MDKNPLLIGVLTSDITYNISTLNQIQEDNSCIFQTIFLLSDKPEVVTNNKNIIPSFLLGEGLNRREEGFHQKVSSQILKKSLEFKIDLLFLDGFYIILTDPLISSYNGRILNFHPSLLPKFGGRGMFGIHVHEAVLAAGEKQTGCTMHLVDAGIDSGEILSQQIVEVNPGETAKSLAQKVIQSRGVAFVKAIKILQKRIHNSTS